MRLNGPQTRKSPNLCWFHYLYRTLLLHPHKALRHQGTYSGNAYWHAASEWFEIENLFHYLFSQRREKFITVLYKRWISKRKKERKENKYGRTYLSMCRVFLLCAHSFIHRRKKKIVIQPRWMRERERNGYRQLKITLLWQLESSFIGQKSQS